MLILPAIDVRGGKCVRLFMGDYNQETVYADDPLDVARQFEAAGATWLHLVDLDGARAGLPENFDTLRRIAAETDLKIEFGGGIRTLDSAKAALHLGADRVVIGTRLAQDEVMAAQFFNELGNEAVAGIDTKNAHVAIHGWTDTAEITGVEFAERMEAIGCRRIVFTDVSTDGTLTGPNFDATADIVAAVKIPVIASGGVSGIDDLRRLSSMGVEGVIVGKAIYENRIDLRATFEEFQPHR
jgi:phosphoribosylformimino-5-aminoimidazole carboxamide ribotide isomerase